MTNSLIAQAVEPLRADAIDRAEAKAREYLVSVSDSLASVGFDLDKLAPMPKWSDGEYKQKLHYRNSIESVTKHDWPSSSKRPSEPNLCKMDFEVSSRFVENRKKEASSQFDSYISKLEQKIGKVVKAELSGNFVWNHSIMTVTKEDGSVENWKTQMIINVSVLGTLFNQFPTRKVK